MDIYDASRYTRVDYRHYRQDNATVLPAIHSSFMSYSGRADVQEVIERHGFNSFADFNFLSQNGLYVYDAALYSAGGAELDIAESKRKTPGIWQRRNDTVLMSDSGGFQVSKGLWSPKDYWEKREKILRWQEEISDIGIAMDVPSGAVNNPKATSIREFDDALRWSKRNFRWQAENRSPSKMCLLNVIQGLETKGPAGADRWYEEVKEFNDQREWNAQAFDGWSFGGHAAQNTQAALLLISKMLDDGLIGNWLHFLGATKIERVATFTLLQKALRKLLGDETFTVSCDSSNACFAVGTKGHYYADGKKSVIQRKVMHAAWFKPSCGKDCRGHCTPANPDCGPCVKARLEELFAYLATSTININLFKRGDVMDWVRAIHDLVNLDEVGRLSRTGYLYFMNVSMEMFLRHTYERSIKIVETQTDMVDRLAAALKSQTPETDLAKLKLA